ncbi:MAG: M28 family peptidase [Candidatus Eisenbacteria sp.]|nr:M28 family peptidase [Candidatus Eisenbacteria bacterium]
MMRILTIAFILVTVPAIAAVGTAVPPITLDELEAHVEYLADPAREGRGLGTAGIDSAAAYIAHQFEQFGLQPAGQGGTFFQPFEARTKIGNFAARNVVALLPGAETQPGHYIILGAHYDHLGYGEYGSNDPGVHAVHPGADDNASGIAGLLEMAEYFAGADPLHRTLVFVAFSAEEHGLLGSAYFADHPAIPLDKTLAMINLDAVGRPTPGEVTLFGMKTAAEFDSLLAISNTEGLKIKIGHGNVGPSDHSSFVLKNVPAVHFFGAAHTDIHRPTDTADKINYPGLEQITGLAARFVGTLDQLPGSLTFEKPAERTRPRTHGGKGAHLGIIPDFGGSDRGMAISGVREGSPAEKAGLQAGDAIVNLGGVDVNDIGDLFAALGASSPGDTVAIEVLRDSKRVTLEAILGKSSR